MEEIDKDYIFTYDGELYSLNDLLESLILMGKFEEKINQIKNQVDRINNKLRNCKF